MLVITRHYRPLDVNMDTEPQKAQLNTNACRYLPDGEMQRLTVCTSYISFLYKLSEVKHRAYQLVVCLSVIFTAVNKARHRSMLSLCQSNTSKQDFTSLSRRSWAGISSLFFFLYELLFPNPILFLYCIAASFGKKPRSHLLTIKVTVCCVLKIKTKQYHIHL